MIDLGARGMYYFVAVCVRLCRCVLFQKDGRLRRCVFVRCVPGCVWGYNFVAVCSVGVCLKKGLFLLPWDGRLRRRVFGRCVFEKGHTIVLKC